MVLQNPTIIYTHPVYYFLKGTELLIHRCEKCVEIKGDCVEK
jgi:hypothetical protein